jgi:hypothetical protein
MLATCSGANCGASSITTRPASSCITITRAGSIFSHSSGEASASTLAMVGGGARGVLGGMQRQGEQQRQAGDQSG